MKSKSATLEDVARHAGVSYQTVSRVLNKSANVSEATRRKVEKIDRGLTLCAKPAGAAAGGEGEPDGRAGDYFSGLACAFPGGGGGKTLCQPRKVTRF